MLWGAMVIIDCGDWQAGDVAWAVRCDTAASAAAFGGSAGDWRGPGSCSCGGGMVVAGRGLVLF